MTIGAPGQGGDAAGDLPRARAAVALALLVAYFLATGFAGLDFGVHWDESYHQRMMKHCIATLSWFPPGHIYNGVYLLVGLPFLLLKAAPYAPRVLHELAHRDLGGLQDFAGAPVTAELQRVLTPYVDSDRYLLAVRGLCLVLSSLAIVWVYLAARVILPARRTWALAAAAFVALSWEVGYHARFVAVDMLVTQFVALEMWLFLRAWHAPPGPAARRWALGAAAAAGAAWATKSTALFAILPLLVLVGRRTAAEGRLRLGGALAGTYAAVAFALSPGTFLDPLRTYAAMAYEQRNYNSEVPPNCAYLVSGFLEHAYRAGVWLLGVVPSHFVPVAVAFSLLAAVGAWRLVGDDRAVRVWAGCALLFFVFIASNHMLIVRNHLPAIPTLALLFAGGLATIAGRLSPRTHRLFLAGVVLGFAANAVWGIRAAASIRLTSPASVVENLRRDVLRARAPFRLAPRLAAALGPSTVGQLRCRPETPSGEAARPTVYLFWKLELLSDHHLNNRVRALPAFYGPLDANHDWYVTFFGKMKDERIVGLSWDQAHRLALAMDGYLDCGVPY